MDTRDEVLEEIQSAKHILVIQGENPDGDSLASALALEEILGEMGKTVTLFCAVDIPKHLRYLEGWDRVTKELPHDSSLTLIVDTASEALLEKTFSDRNVGTLRANPLILIDHHDVETTMPLPVTEFIDPNAAATGEVIFNLFKDSVDFTLQATKYMTISIMYDTRGLSTDAVTPELLRLVADFVEAGVKLAELDEARMAMNRRDEDISRYKGELLQRAEYNQETGLATVDITWEEIEKYSDRYNPAVLVLDEMRLVTGTRLAIAYKTYPDGKILAKIRANYDAPVAGALAEAFGGGGHPHASGFKKFGDDFENLKLQVEEKYRSLIKEHDES